MKTVFSALYRIAPTILSALLLNQFTASAQTTFSFPVVTIKATDPVALESGKPATFTVFRAGSTNASLLVYYNIGGTASNGVNYTNISHFLSVPAGATSATITIQPIPDTNVDTEEGTLSVVLQLAPSPLMIPVNFTIGIPNTATAYIFDDDSGSNLPPVVSMIAPPNGSVFYNPASISLIATAFDPDGSVTNVEFYANGKDLGRGLMVVMDPPGVNGVTGPVYFFNWTNPQFGDYALTAVATDNGGLSTTSAPPVNIRVLPAPPVVKITNPTNGQMFIAPVNIPVSATAVSSNADVVRVDFFADDHFIGADTGTNKAEYDITWSNAIPGFYVLRAVATDSLGGKGFSPPVFISVVGTVPPPTNTPVVTIYARDPIAVVGTNCVGTYTNPIANGLLMNRIAVTNSATFVVRRAGPTNMDLTVYYSIAGTASNGEDYVTLPGSVTIPAGKHAAPVVVVPLLEDVPECPETVVLTLQEPTNVPPPYFVGWPDKAAAIIVDCDFLPPATSVLCAGDFHCCYLPSPTSTPYYRLDCSVDLTHWLTVCTNTASAIGIHFTDPDTCSFPNRFYRVVPQTNAPLIDW